MDYSKIDGLLKAGHWKEADQETTSLMLRVVNRGKDGVLNASSMKNFPCEVLSQIDHLWMDNSNGKFGFSVQKKIYFETCGGTDDGQFNGKPFVCFSRHIGWLGITWLNYSNLTFDLKKSLEGELPSLGRLCVSGTHWFRGSRFIDVSFLMQRLMTCSMSQP
ncbi:MAG TPA: GUN4 domain-containing protein [Coleofasciculaceae cyanobacterium]|jgi:hypothetical protein